MGTSGAFIAICVTAIADGGPAMLATLVLISSFFQFAFSARLSLLRRILTPTVAGTVIMLIPVTVMPIVFDMLNDVPDGMPAEAAPLSALATILVVAGIALRATGALRLWAPVIGIVAGSAVAGYYGSVRHGPHCRRSLDRGFRHSPGRVSIWTSGQLSGPSSRRSYS